MRYTLLLNYPEMDAGTLDEETMVEGQRAMSNYAAALHEAGVLVEAQVFQSFASATTLTMVDGSVHVQDGPLADSKMPLGGFFLIDVPGLDAAIDWASRVPSLEWGAVEVRPGAVHVVDGGWAPSS